MTTAPSTNPFTGIPISDFVRDGGAVLLLLLSLAMPWTSTSFDGYGPSFAAGRVDVVLITLLSVASVSLTYLARGRVLPPAMTVNTVWLIRELVNVPYLLLVIVYIIIDAVTGRGLGTAAAFGLAGVVLAAQPREAETRAFVAGAPISVLWRRIALGFGGVAVLTTFIALVLSLVSFIGSGYPPASVLYALIVSLAMLAASALLYYGIARRSEAGRLAAFGVGGAVLGAVLIDLFTRFALSGYVYSLHGAGGYVVIFAAVLAALASAPAVRAGMSPADPVRRWLTAAGVVLLALAGLAGLSLLTTVISLVGGFGYLGVPVGIIMIVCCLGIAALAVFARMQLTANPANRMIVLILTGGTLVLGLVYVVLAGLAWLNSVLSIVLAFGLPIVVAVFLTVPKEVRAYYAAVAAARPVYAPAGPPAPPAAAPADPRIAIALDPATPAATLHQFAVDEPALRQYVAANPSTYPDLLTWLGTLGDPAVNAALAARA
ncbi:MAG: hypothetical protein KKH51_08580 [Actinobacteria bacterium]|nr:hypothetical protein [Actinomycetota bacterium]